MDEHTRSPVLAAAAAGDVDYLSSVRASWSSKVLREAAEYGQLACLRYLYEHGCPSDATAVEGAAMYGHIDCLIYLYRDARCGIGWCSCDFAALGGHLECLRFLRFCRAPWGSRTMLRAVRGDHVDCVRFLIKEQCPGLRHALVHAVQLKRPRVLRYLLTMGHRASNDAWMWESVRDNADCLAVLRDFFPCPPALGEKLAQLVLLPKWRALVRTRAIAVYWYAEVGRAAYAPGGLGRKRDYDAFVADMGFEG